MADMGIQAQCYRCGKRENLAKHSRYTLKDGTIRERYICRECNTRRTRKKRGTIIVSTPPRIYRPIPRMSLDITEVYED